MHKNTYRIRPVHFVGAYIIVLHIPHDIEIIVIWSNRLLGYVIYHLTFEVAKFRDSWVRPCNLNCFTKPTHHYLAPLPLMLPILDVPFVCLFPSIPNQVPRVRIQYINPMMDEVDHINWEVTAPQERHNDLQKGSW